jgi:glycosyltransferase involved in cell wall biosynthesis
MDKKTTDPFPGKLGILQRVLPVYRAPFFDLLAEACQGGLSLFAGYPRPDEAIGPPARLSRARFTRAANIQPLSASSPLYLGWQAGLAGWLRSWQPDVLIVEANPRLLSTRLAVRWMQARKRPVIGWGLGAPAIGRGILASLLEWNRAGFLRSLNGMIAYSQRGADEYRPYGFPPGRIMVAPNAVTPRPVAPLPPRQIDAHSRPLVLYVGRLQARKRIDLLLRACSSLPEKIQPEVWVVGDGPAAGELKDIAKEVYPLAKFPGAKFGPELEPYYQADLFVLPGTGGLAVQEAMAHGLPVIVAEGDGTQDDLVRAANGWRVLPGDLSALKGALQEALMDRPRLHSMGAESYRIVSEEVNLEMMVKVFLQMVHLVSEG